MTISNLSMVTVQHKMVGLERMSDYRGVTVCAHHLKSYVGLDVVF